MCNIEHFADRLIRACRDKGAPICVGIDPVYERLPAELRDPQAPWWPDTEMADVLEESGPWERRLWTIEHFADCVLETVAEHVPCVKIQSACFERYRPIGVTALHALIEKARELGVLVINDAKRGDIGISAEHYAAGCLADFDDADQTDPESGWGEGPDALTINPYFGVDGVKPFVDVAAAQGKGLFALVRTSNPSGDALQGLQLADGRSVAEAVAQMIADIGSADGLVGESGYSLLGAVVGATKPQDAARLRDLMPQQVFLVPGFGAQGGKADDVKACFKPDGTGAIVTASRSVIYAYEKTGVANWRGAIEAAAVRMKQQVNAVLR